MITKFKIFEGRGISNIIKQYSKIIYEYFLEGNNEFQLDFDYDTLPLIDLKIIIKKSDINHGDYDLKFSDIKNFKLHDVIIEIEYNNINMIHGMINHELNHINEYYNIQIKMIKTNIVIKPTWTKIQLAYKELNISKTDFYYNFIYLLYLSLDNEMNARIAQVYDYLYNFKIKDEKILFEKIKEHQNWKYIEMLNNFDSDNFVQECINRISLNGIINITNSLIEKFKNKDVNITFLNKKIYNKNIHSLKFLDNKINNLEDLKTFYNEWSKYFKTKCKKHIDKYKYLIKEVIEDLNGNRPFNEAQRNRINFDDFDYDNFLVKK